jgi:hypothetical protein
MIIIGFLGLGLLAHRRQSGLGTPLAEASDSLPCKPARKSINRLKMKVQYET